MTPREMFKAQLDGRAAARAEAHTAFENLDKEYRETLVAQAHLLHPERRTPNLQLACKWLSIEAVKRITDSFRARIDTLWAEKKELEKRYNDTLHQLAPAAEIHQAPTFIERARASTSSYSTQGYGADMYARGAAEQLADQARFNGVEATVVRVVTPILNAPGLNSLPLTKLTNVRNYVEYVVSFGVESDLDVAIIRYRPAPSLREQVRMCWKRGCNPRVYNPYLPPGYEEQNGLDCFGNDLRAGKPD